MAVPLSPRLRRGDGGTALVCAEDMELRVEQRLSKTWQLAGRANRRWPASQVSAYTSRWFFSGRLRTGFPVAAWMALSTAGATTQIVGSPTPPQKS
jgi:hypothetical protein